MSDQTGKANADPTQANALGTQEPQNTTQTTKTTVSVEDLMQQVQQLHATNERLLKESQKYKLERNDYKKQVDTAEQKKLEEQGQYKTLAEKAQQDAIAWKQRHLHSKLDLAVSSEASKAGCIDTDALLALGNKELLQYDEQSDKVLGAETFVEDVKQRKPFLFGVSGGNGSGSVINVQAPKGVEVKKKLTQHDLRNLTQAEITAAWEREFTKTR